MVLLVPIMRLADDGDWNWFMAKLNKLHPKYDPKMLLPFVTNEPADEDPEHLSGETCARRLGGSVTPRRRGCPAALAARGRAWTWHVGVWRSGWLGG